MWNREQSYRRVSPQQRCPGIYVNLRTHLRCPQPGMLCGLSYSLPLPDRAAEKNFGRFDSRKWETLDEFSTIVVSTMCTAGSTDVPSARTAVRLSGCN